MADPPAASLAVGIPHSPPLEVELRLKKNHKQVSD
jgi:hypothetical protein